MCMFHTCDCSATLCSAGTKFNRLYLWKMVIRGISEWFSFNSHSRTVHVIHISCMYIKVMKKPQALKKESNHLGALESWKPQIDCTCMWDFHVYLFIFHPWAPVMGVWHAELTVKCQKCLEISDVVCVIHSLATGYSWTLGTNLSEISIKNSNFHFNSLAPGKFEWNFRYVIFKWILMVDGWSISCEIALILMSLDFTDDQSTLVQVMAWCRQATSHYLSQCWPRSLSPYGVIRPQWVKENEFNNKVCKMSGMFVQISQC